MLIQKSSINVKINLIQTDLQEIFTRTNKDVIVISFYDSKK
jgi:hypothetical protein